LHPDDRVYYEVMTPEIENRFGDGIVEKLKRQAEASIKKQRSSRL